MDISVAKRAVLVLVCLVLFSTCGELETLFPSNGTYQVRTLVNGSSLDECSIIRSNDKIRPYFASSVTNDPDLIGLLVYVQDSQGKIIGQKVQYTLLSYAGETALTEVDFQEEATKPNEAVEPVPETSEVKPQAAEKKSNIEIAVKSLAAELPYFPLPKEMEIGSYILVFEALGKRETLSRMEINVFYLGSAEFNLKDISMYLSGLSGPQLIPPGTVIMLEASLDFDNRLDPYLVWYNGKNIISEGKISDGAGKLLWKAPEQAGFYSLRMEAFPLHLKRTAYAGLSREIALPVSPKAISLGYFFENNEEYTARSSLSTGTAYAAAGEENPASSPAPELFQWYQFEGSLLSSLALTGEQTLLPDKESRSRWAAAGQSYGLAIGPDDTYLIPSIKFFRNKQNEGGGILLLHIRPLSEGIIFSAFFPPQSPLTSGVWIDMIKKMDMIKKENVIMLRLSAADTFVELPVYLTFPATEGLIPIAVEFYIRPSRLEAKISLDEYSQSQAGAIKLPGVLSGEGRIRLGGVVDKSTLDKSAVDNSLTSNAEEAPFEMITKIDSFEEAAAYVPVTDTIWDELAILFSTIPLLPEGSLEIANVQYVVKPVLTKPAEANIPLQEQETQEREAQ